MMVCSRPLAPTTFAAWPVLFVAPIVPKVLAGKPPVVTKASGWLKLSSRLADRKKEKAPTLLPIVPAVFEVVKVSCVL